MPYTSVPETLEHRAKVVNVITHIADELVKRGHEHDQSKMESPELETFDKITPLLKGLTYGSEEYRKVLRDMKPTMDHHYAMNRHHAEHFANGISDMNLIDVVEMLCDWYAASQRHADGDIYKSIEQNKERFGYDNMLARIFVNTITFIKGAENGRASGT
jgi:hypothetical protein